MDLSKLGFDDWFQNQHQKLNATEKTAARVIAVNRDNFDIIHQTGEATAELAGKLLYAAESSEHLPTVGDWVLVDLFNEGTLGIIHDILPRKSLLKRKKAGKSVDVQTIAANIDTAFIIQSLDEDFNPNRLERYLVMLNESRVEPVILLSKSDLISANDLSEKIQRIDHLSEKYQIVYYSALIETGIEAVKNQIKPASTYCLLGSSGVGKTTLLNKLLNAELFVTKEVREKDSRGRHATSRRQLIILENDAMIIDTPGMRELGNFDIEDGLTETFADIARLASACKFKNCTHHSEPGCAIQEALTNGDLEETHFQNYLKLKKEAAFYDMSYLEKRRRDKQFGKMVKQVMKHKKQK